MKVKEMIERLGNCDPDAEVHVAYPAGDYWRNILAPVVRDVDDGEVIHSEYHRTFKLIADEDRERQLDEGQKTISVVVIR